MPSWIKRARYAGESVPATRVAASKDFVKLDVEDPRLPVVCIFVTPSSTALIAALTI